MPARRRIERLNEQFKRELMEILLRELKDPRVKAVTVTSVDVSPDLYHARVYLTTLLEGTDRDTILEGLEAARPFLRRELSHRLRMRRTPELAFTWDETLDHARRIEQLLAQVRTPRPATPDDA
jgi:ribosome-binding factor A